ncbi:MAG: hypothetical protein HY043_16035 [Verrucomicrobia bacterium]|nr:hypothetical protein [Verrucomicrobiota bacterium]
MKPARIHSCNVVEIGAENAQLWQFSANNGAAELQTEQRVLITERLPAALVAKNWRALWQRKLNLAWLPARQVFLRVIQLPTNEATEVASMIELQLEKLSPLPVAQIVWSFELLPAKQENSMTAIIVIVARNRVEEFLGQLESQGYLADRLELPFLHQLFVTEFEGDGVWLYPGADAQKRYCLVAWHYANTLQSLSLVHLSATENWPQALRAELAQMAWAGELEGWLTSPPQVHLVAEAALVASWEPVVREISGEAIRFSDSLPVRELAALNVQRITRAEANSNLLPPEFAARYQQQFIDGLWMRGLAAVVILYFIGVAIYFGALEVVKFQAGRVDQQVKTLTGSYTNALQMKARILVLQEQADLKYAALDAWKAVTDNLPQELTLQQINFSRTGKVTISGFGSEDAKVVDFIEALQKVAVNKRPLFSRVGQQSIQTRPGALGPRTVFWGLDCQLQTSEAP